MTAEEALAQAVNDAIGSANPPSKLLARAILAALSAAGWAVVRRDMIDNAAHRLNMSDLSIDRECGADLAAMLAAATADIPASGPQTAGLRVKPD